MEHHDSWFFERALDMSLLADIARQRLAQLLKPYNEAHSKFTAWLHSEGDAVRVEKPEFPETDHRMLCTAEEFYTMQSHDAWECFRGDGF